MNTVTWSPNLFNLIQSLKKLDPSEIASKLKDHNFLNSWDLSSTELNAVSTLYCSKESKTEGPENTWN